MDPELAGALTGSACCLVMWAAMAAPVLGLAHWRTRKVEAELGRPAMPTAERAMLFYAGASVVWLSAIALALVGLAKKDWTRLGRNCLFITALHFTAVVFIALTAMGLDAAYGRDEMRMVLLCLPLVALGATAAAAFGWRWSSARASRIEAEPPTDASDPGVARWLVPILSLAFWPAGLVALFVYGAPENVWVGTWSVRAMIVNLTAIAWLVVVGIMALSQLV